MLNSKDPGTNSNTPWIGLAHKETAFLLSFFFFQFLRTQVEEFEINYINGMFWEVGGFGAAFDDASGLTAGSVIKGQSSRALGTMWCWGCK